METKHHEIDSEQGRFGGSRTHAERIGYKSMRAGPGKVHRIGNPVRCGRKCLMGNRLQAGQVERGTVAGPWLVGLGSHAPTPPRPVSCGVETGASHLTDIFSSLAEV